MYEVINNSILTHLKKNKKKLNFKKIDIQKKDLVTLSGIFF